MRCHAIDPVAHRDPDAPRALLMAGADEHRAGVEERTRLWLEANFLQAIAAGRGQTGWRTYDDDGRPCRMTRLHFQEILRKLKIFRWLDRLRFESFVDVGSGFDQYPNLVHARYGVPAFFSDLAHTYNLPYGGVTDGRLDHAVTLNIARLPFRDDAFDVVLASEVLEHLVRPVEAIGELLRVARRAVVMTSLEALAPSRWTRFVAHHRVDVRRPHVERNFLLLRELAATFGSGFHHECLLQTAAAPDAGTSGDPAAAYAALGSVDAVAEALCRAVASGAHGPGAMGIVLVKTEAGVTLAPADAGSDLALARWLVERTATAERAGHAIIDALSRGDAIDLAAADRPVAPALLDRLCCPDCRAVLAPVRAGVVCTGCGTRFAAEYGVPILYPSRVPDGPEAEVACLDRVCGDDAGRRRVVRRVMRRLRRNEAAPGPFRRWLWGLPAEVATEETTGLGHVATTDARGGPG